MPEDDTSNNALGLDFIEKSDQSDSHTPQEQEPSPDLSTVKKEKEKPYVNPERVKTGGAQRDKLSDEALQERMTRIREQNEKIKQRRLDVQADEEAFRKMQEAERVKQVENRKIQAEIDRARDQNAKRKMDKVQSREWDSGKGSGERERRGPPPRKTDSYNRPPSASNQLASKQSNSIKLTSSKSASTKPTSNEASVNEPTLDEPSSNKLIPAPGPPKIPEIPEIPISENVFPPDQENDYSAWFTAGDTTASKEASVEASLPAAQEKPDYSEWFTGDTSNTTQNYSDWSTPDQSVSQPGIQTGSHPSPSHRDGDRGGGRGRGRGRGRREGGRGSSNTGSRRGTEQEVPKPS